LPRRFDIKDFGNNIMELHSEDGKRTHSSGSILLDPNNSSISYNDDGGLRLDDMYPVYPFNDSVINFN